EQLILKVAAQADDDWRFVIVPHEIKFGLHYLKTLRQESKHLIFQSDMEAGDDYSDKKILIFLKMGLLSSIYKYADIAYIGGGFGKGIHNTLEAAVFGIPVLFGPNYKKFSEAKMLIANGGGKSVKNFTELKSAF